MTDFDIVQRVSTLCVGTINKRKKRGDTWKQTWMARVCGKRAVYVMNLVYPFMGQRRQSKIREVLEKYARRRTLAIAGRERWTNPKYRANQAASIQARKEVNAILAAVAAAHPAVDSALKPV